MTTKTFMLPIFADGLFEVDLPENWDKLTKEAKIEYVSENLNKAGSLCHQCSNGIQSDFEIDVEPAEEYIDDLIDEGYFD